MTPAPIQGTLTPMRKLIAKIIAALIGLTAVAGCPQPLPGPNKPGIIDCTTQAVRDHGIALVPKVNDCLQGMGGWMGCITSLIQPGAAITEDVVACVVQASGRSYAASAEANRNDVLSSTGAMRARAYLDDKGYTFK